MVLMDKENIVTASDARKNLGKLGQRVEIRASRSLLKRIEKYGQQYTCLTKKNFNADFHFCLDFAPRLWNKC